MRLVISVFISMLGIFLYIKPTQAADCSGFLSPGFWKAAKPGEISSCLSIGAPLNGRNESGETPLHLAAARTSNTEVIHLLIALGADTELVDKSGFKPMHHGAAFSEHPEVLTALMLHDLDPDTEKAGKKCSIFRPLDTCSTRPLHLAAKRSDPEAADVVAALLVGGADANSLDEIERTPLHHAARQANSLTVMLLLSGGAEIEKKDGKGNTPLHIAAAREDLQAYRVTEVLLGNGASITLGNSEGTTPMMLAAAYGMQDVFNRMMDGHESKDVCDADERGRTVLSILEERAAWQKDDTYWRLHQLCRS